MRHRNPPIFSSVVRVNIETDDFWGGEKDNNNGVAREIRRIEATSRKRESKASILYYQAPKKSPGPTSLGRLNLIVSSDTCVCMWVGFFFRQYNVCWDCWEPKATGGKDSSSLAHIIIRSFGNRTNESPHQSFTMCVKFIYYRLVRLDGT